MLIHLTLVNTYFHFSRFQVDDGGLFQKSSGHSTTTFPTLTESSLNQSPSPPILGGGRFSLDSCSIKRFSIQVKKGNPRNRKSQSVNKPERALSRFRCFLQLSYQRGSMLQRPWWWSILHLYELDYTLQFLSIWKRTIALHFLYYLSLSGPFGLDGSLGSGQYGHHLPLCHQWS